MKRPSKPRTPSRRPRAFPRKDHSTDPRLLLGEYPVQSPKIVPPADEAGEIWRKSLASTDAYPLREKHLDPRWAVGTVWLWVIGCLACIAFVFTLIILGAIFD
jgi:hypothetical protein